LCVNALAIEIAPSLSIEFELIFNDVKEELTFNAAAIAGENVSFTKSKVSE
jgi:hypothetical protein